MEPFDQRIVYRGFIITYDPPPIPDRRSDWHFQHEQFDGAPDAGDNRCGDAASVTDCFCEIDILLDGEPLELNVAVRFYRSLDEADLA